MNEKIKISNPRYATEDCQLINCEIEHSQYGRILFSASATDEEQYGRDIFAAIVAGEAGPIEQYRPPPAPSIEKLSAIAREKRNFLLSQSDWTQLKDAQAMMSESEKSSWTLYRQQLRDISKQASFPTEVDWPVQP